MIDAAGKMLREELNAILSREKNVVSLWNNDGKSEQLTEVNAITP